jgi:3-hydroxyisobutyrate dehydrogenase-like beta-hydroxyacid dehydrogenase
MDIGFIGLGSMGLPMATKLLEAGHSLTVFNRSASKATPLLSAGATLADVPGEAGKGSVVFTMVADDVALESATFGDNGILESMPKDAIHVSMSTISVELAKRLTEEHKARGQKFVAAPVMGRPDAAAAGQLRIMAAGDDATLKALQPLFDLLGQQTLAIGPEPYMAAVLKLANNFLLVSMVEAYSQASALVEASGIDPEKYYECVSSVWASPMLSRYAKLVVDEAFTPGGFKLELALKDIRLALAAGEGAKVPLPLADLAKQHLMLGVSRGHGEKDLAALSLAVKAAMGID